ncbi:MAG: hypothetical protein WDN28_07480 [Chthoniobacter sp.]
MRASTERSGSGGQRLTGDIGDINARRRQNPEAFHQRDLRVARVAHRGFQLESGLRRLLLSLEQLGLGREAPR